MKKIIYFLILSLAVTFTSCDYVANPYPVKNANVSDTASCGTPSFVTPATHYRKVLIEDYTGHECPNCPRAARELYKLDTMYPGRIIGLAIHPNTGLALPDPGYPHQAGTPPTAFAADFRTTVGTTYDDFFKVSSSEGLPDGMINRRDYDGTSNNHLKFDLDWETYLTNNNVLNDPSVVDLQININYSASTRKICCVVKDSFLTSVTGNYRLVALITQDSIIDWQDDGGTINSNYVFRDMLRDAITPTGAWGEPLIGVSVSAGTTQIRHFAYTVPTAYTNIPVVISHCYIVAFIYNYATKEIIQSEKAKITP